MTPTTPSREEYECEVHDSEGTPTERVRGAVYDGCMTCATAVVASLEATITSLVEVAKAGENTGLCPCCAHRETDTAEECGGYRDGKRIQGFP
ncbi:MAG: hypothetical protein WA125_04720, partial [Desulfosporosinus sp.]